MLINSYCYYKNVNLNDIDGFDLHKSGLKDIDSIASWAAAQVKAAISIGILAGKEDCFDPEGCLTRAEAAQSIFNAFYKDNADTDTDDSPVSSPEPESTYDNPIQTDNSITGKINMGDNLTIKVDEDQSIACLWKPDNDIPSPFLLEEEYEMAVTNSDPEVVKLVNTENMLNPTFIVVRGLKPGTSVITFKCITEYGEASASCTVTVIEKNAVFSPPLVQDPECPIKIVLAKMESRPLKIGEKRSIYMEGVIDMDKVAELELPPGSLTKNRIVCTSGDPDVIEVTSPSSGHWEMKGLKAGTSVITAYLETSYGWVADSMTMTVTDVD